MPKTRTVLVAISAALLLLSGCSQPTSVTPGSTFSTEPTAAKVELNGVPYRLVIAKTPIGDLADDPSKWAGYTDLAALLINPDANPDGTYDWYAYKISQVGPDKAVEPYSVQSSVILVGHVEGAGYVFDVTTTCTLVTRTATSPMSNWGELTSGDDRIVKLTPVGTDTCSKPAEEAPQK